MPSVPSSPRVKLRAATRRVPRARSSGKVTEEAADYEPEPNMKLSRALAVVLLLHVVAIGGIIAFSLIKDHNPGHPTVAGDTVETAAASEAEDAHLPAASGRDLPDGAPRPAIHVVQRGETLTRIANANGVSLEALLAVNGSATISGIRPGQQIRLPEKVSAPAALAATAGNEAPSPATQKNSAQDDADLAAVNLTPPNTGMKLAHAAATPGQATPAVKPPHTAGTSGQTYTVGKGESPYTIAQKFKVSPEALLKLNAINDPKKIKPGQKLYIPAKPDPKSKLKA